MPAFPIARNTLRYVENREAISTHNHDWPAAVVCLVVNGKTINVCPLNSKNIAFNNPAGPAGLSKGEII